MHVAEHVLGTEGRSIPNCQISCIVFGLVNTGLHERGAAEVLDARSTKRKCNPIWG